MTLEPQGKPYPNAIKSKYLQLWEKQERRRLKQRATYHFIKNLPAEEKKKREQTALWWKLKKHFNHVEYFSLGETEYRFNGDTLEIVV